MNRALWVVCLLGVAGASRADFDPTRWPYLRPLAKGADGFVRVEVDRSAYARSAPGLSDLRLLDAAGAEVPFELEQYLPGTTAASLPARILSLGKVAQQTVFEIDAGDRSDLPPEKREHNRVELDTREYRNFTRRVEISASAEGKEYRVLVPDGLIFQYELGTHRVHEMRVPYPTTDFRYLRVRLLAGEGRVPEIRGARLQRVVDVPGEARTVEVAVFSHLAQDRKSVVDFDLGSDRSPVDLVTLHVGTPRFVREVEAATSEDKARWHLAGHREEISRVQVGGEGGRDVVRTDISTPGARGRHLRITVHNADDAPLEIRGATVTWYPHFVVFQAEAAKTYRLAYGNPKARPPSYDLARQLASAAPAVKPGPGLDPEAPNPRYEPERTPWTERLPWLPDAALGLGGLALALVLFRSIRAMRKA